MSKIPIEILIGQSLRRRIEIKLFSSKQLQMSVVGLYLIRHLDQVRGKEERYRISMVSAVLRTIERGRSPRRRGPSFRGYADQSQDLKR